MWDGFRRSGNAAVVFCIKLPVSFLVWYASFCAAVSITLLRQKGARSSNRSAGCKRRFSRHLVA